MISGRCRARIHSRTKRHCVRGGGGYHPSWRCSLLIYFALVVSVDLLSFPCLHSARRFRVLMQRLCSPVNSSLPAPRAPRRVTKRAIECVNKFISYSALLSALLIPRGARTLSTRVVYLLVNAECYSCKRH